MTTMDKAEQTYLLAKGLFDEEEGRRRELDDRAKTILSLSTLYAGFVVFVIKDGRPPTGAALFTVGCGIAFLSLSLAFATWSTLVRTYETPFVADDLVRDYDDPTLSPQLMIQARVADYIVAVRRNAKVCDRKATMLSCAHTSLLLGIVFHALSALLMI